MKSEIIRILIKFTYNKPTNCPAIQASNIKPQPETLYPKLVWESDGTLFIYYQFRSIQSRGKR